MSEPAAPKQILMAAWVAPMTGPIIRDGAVITEGDRVLAVGEERAIRAAHPDAVVFDCGSSVLLPGLVNAHTHLELTFATRPDRPASFVGWVMQLMRQAATKTGPSTWVASVYDGVEQCARFGVTSLGDIKSRFIRDGRMMMALLSNAVRFTSYGEVTAMAQRRELLDERLGDAVEEPEDTPGVRVGVSPHAPYSIEDGGYRRCLAIARERGLPLTTHLAETPDEAEFLATHTGPFRDLWARLGAWDDRVPAFDGGPIRYAQALGLLDYERTLLAHVNYCDDDELAILARGKASVVYCPRTHRYFGHPPHRWREMLATGINVAVGTDSCASSPDLNLVDDLRLLHEIAPEVEPRLLWEVATVRGARAIDAPRVGSLTPGQYADVVAFAVSSADPLREILESRIEPVRVWCGGRMVKSARG